MTILQHQFVCETVGERLDTFLASQLDGQSRSYLKKLIDENRVKVDNRPEKASFRLKVGQQVTLDMPEPILLDAVAQNIELEIVYEDDHLVVINKPKGMVVHPSAGNHDGTLVNALMHHCDGKLSDINGTIRPGIVHRIDKFTSGLLVVAKTNEAHHKLSDQLKDHTMARTYEAIVDGYVKEDSGTIDAPIGRHSINRKKMDVQTNGRQAVTHFEVVWRYKNHTHMRFELETGRTHQIRVHMAHVQHPITGDPVYGRPCKLMKTEGQMLHAKKLRFIHPFTNELVTFEVPLPAEFLSLLALLGKKEGN